MPTRPHRPHGLHHLTDHLVTQLPQATLTDHTSRLGGGHIPAGGLTVHPRPPPATVRNPAPVSHPRRISRTSTTETSRNAIYRTPTSHDMDRSDTGSDQPPRRDTPGGPITGNQVVPSSWQKTAHSGPMTMAGDIYGWRVRQ